MSEVTSDTNHDNAKSFQQINTKISSLLDMLDNDPVSVKDGLDFLNVKNNVMLSYLIEITLLLKQKSEKKDERDDDEKQQQRNRLSELKLILDKYRPMEKKLQYQIDKILSQSENDTSNFEEDTLVNEEDDDIDPSSLRPNPESMHTEPKPKEKKSTYRAPRLTSIHYQNAESQKQKELKTQAKQRDTMRKSELLQTLKTQYTDAPEEDDYQGGATASIGNTKWKRYQEKEKEKTHYEERNMTRLITTKKDKKERNDMLRGNENNLYSLADLGNLSGGISAFRGSKKRDKEVRRDEGKDDDIFVEGKKRKEKGNKYKNSLQRDLFDGDRSSKKSKKKRST